MNLKSLFPLLLLSQSGWATDNYIQAQAMRSHSSCEGFRQGVAPLGLTATCDSHDNGFRFSYGRYFGSIWGLEIGYLDAGEGEAKGFAPNGMQVVSLEAPLTAFDLLGTARWQFNDDFLLMGRLGAAHWDYEVNTTQPGFGASNTDTTLSYGVALEYKRFTLGFDVIVDVGQENLLDPTAPDIEQDVERFSIGYKHPF